MRSPVPPVGCPAGPVRTVFWRGSSASLDEHAAAAGRLDPLSRARAEGVRMYGQRLAQLALRQHLDRDVLARAEALGPHQLDRDLGAGVEAALQRGDVDRLGARAEG